ncbi:7793_t:CDS:2, partial [Cetraspora pellucida]
ISIQENTKNLFDELSDKYVVSFLFRNLAADESLEDFNEVEDSVNIDDIYIELEQTEKAAIYMQLPKPPSFDALVYNMPYHKDYIIILTIIILNTNEYAQIKNTNAMGQV